jgi:hypothetical protein
MRVRGSCPGCHADRLLPGRDEAGTPICRDCADIVRDFFCDRCGFEGLLLGGRLCEPCTLTDALSRLLDDGTGRITPSLMPLAKTLLEMDRPKSRLAWLRNPNVVRLVHRRGGDGPHRLLVVVDIGRVGVRIREGDVGHLGVVARYERDGVEGDALVTCAVGRDGVPTDFRDRPVELVRPEGDPAVLVFPALQELVDRVGLGHPPAPLETVHRSLLATGLAGGLDGVSWSQLSGVSSPLSDHSA